MLANVVAKLNEIPLLVGVIGGVFIADELLKCARRRGLEREDGTRNPALTRRYLLMGLNLESHHSTLHYV